MCFYELSAINYCTLVMSLDSRWIVQSFLMVTFHEIIFKNSFVTSSDIFSTFFLFMSLNQTIPLTTMHHPNPFLALRLGMKVLVVVNKIDRPAARPEYVVDKVFDLMMELGASDEQIDFTTVYASGLNGIAGMEPDNLSNDMGPLFDAVMTSIDPPKVSSLDSDDLQCLVSNIDYDQFKGKMGIARITSGTVKNNQAVALARPGVAKKTGRLTSLYVFDN